MKYKKFPRGKYSKIYLDIPWDYNDKGAAGKRGASQHYKTMDLIDLIMMPVQRLANRNCALFMWTTDTFMREALAIMKAWGFRYVRIGFVWVKITKDGKDFRMMLGRYTRSNAEFCLLGIKGKPKVMSHSISQVVATVPGKHSEKPEEVRKRIDRLYHGKGIELFARGKKKRKGGWKYSGNQVYY